MKDFSYLCTRKQNKKSPAVSPVYRSKRSHRHIGSMGRNEIIRRIRIDTKNNI